MKQEVIWLDDTPIAVIRPNSEPHAGLNAGDVEVFFVYPDHLDTPRTIVDVNNQAIWQWHSDPFGTALANQNVDGDLNDFEFNHRFPGQYFDVETGTHYNYFRDYEPETGRYVQSDPIGLDGDLNIYSYVESSPLNYLDSDGLVKKSNRGKLVIVMYQLLSIQIDSVRDDIKHTGVRGAGTNQTEIKPKDPKPRKKPKYKNYKKSKNCKKCKKEKRKMQSNSRKKNRNR